MSMGFKILCHTKCILLRASFKICEITCTTNLSRCVWSNIILITRKDKDKYVKYSLNHLKRYISVYRSIYFVYTALLYHLIFDMSYNAICQIHCHK